MIFGISGGGGKRAESYPWQSAGIVTHIFREMKLHIGYCEGFGITKEEMESTEENEGK